MMLIGLLLIGIFVYMIFTQGNKNMGVSKIPFNPDALEMAKMRLASGEITIEEFEKIKNVIK